jgi:hypothetical protein
MREFFVGDEVVVIESFGHGNVFVGTVQKVATLYKYCYKDKWYQVQVKTPDGLMYANVTSLTPLLEALS